MPDKGPAALSLAVHGILALLLVLSFGQARPLATSAGRAMPTIMLGMDLPKPAVAQALPPPAPPPVPRHVAHKLVAQAPPPMAQLGDTPAEPAQQPVSAVAAEPAVVEPPVPSEATATAEATPAASGPAEALPLLYLAEVSRLIRLRLGYPEQARLDRAKGTAVVHILLARDGTVLGVELVRGAGHPALDAEAREVVLRIHKFPELPDYYARGEQRFAIDQPIGFRGS